MSQIQTPPKNATGITNPVSCNGLTSPVGRNIWIIDIEFPASFGVSQQSIEAEMTAG